MSSYSFHWSVRLFFFIFNYKGIRFFQWIRHRINHTLLLYSLFLSYHIRRLVRRRILGHWVYVCVISITHFLDVKFFQMLVFVKFSQNLITYTILDIASLNVISYHSLHEWSTNITLFFNDLIESSKVYLVLHRCVKTLHRVCCAYIPFFFSYLVENERYT